MDDKRNELSLCFELRAPVHIIEETVRDMLSLPDAKQDLIKWREIVDESHKDKSKIINLPIKDTIWNLQVINTKLKSPYDEKCSHEETMRTMALTEICSGRVVTVQVNIAEAMEISFQEQVRKLLCYGCLHPIGQTPTRPKFLCLENIVPREEIVLDCQEFGITPNVSESSQDVCTPHKSITTDSIVRQCANCSTLASAHLMLACPNCQGVVYCCERCKLEDHENSHKMFCAVFKQSMSFDEAMADFPFSFVNVTTSRNFTTNRKKQFLKEHGVLGIGLWQREYQDVNVEMEGNTDKLLEESNNIYGLPFEGSVLQLVSSHDPPDINQPLTDWSDYYEFRSFPTSSIISVLLTYSLTLYHIISAYLPVDFSEVLSRAWHTKVLTVHIIGAEKEADMFQPFLECARLLQPLKLQLHLFGNNVLAGTHVEATTTHENLAFQIHCGLYHELDHDSIPHPHVVVCFNGGLGAYSTYLPTVRLLMQKEVPLYYTDYGLASIDFSKKIIHKFKVGIVSEPKLNPFRSPFRITSLEQNLPRYNNAFITCIKPYCVESSMSSFDSLMAQRQSNLCSSSD